MDENATPPTTAPAPVHGAGGELVFSVADLPGVREFAALHARRRGMGEDAVTDLLLAVNEVATNAVTHGTPQARVRVRAEGRELVVDVHDDGRAWRPGPLVGKRPPLEATSGMGLWVARLLSRALAVETGPHGTTVTMRFPF